MKSFLALILVLVAQSASGSGAFSTVSDLALGNLCSKEIVLLGEASHGDGKTLEFKVELVQRLVNECHFNAVLMESGIYDFLKIQRDLDENHSASYGKVASAIGDIWSKTKEVEPLIRFLQAKLNSRSIVVGGIDDQLTGSYAREMLATDLTKYLSKIRARQSCQRKIQQFTNYEYDEKDPYTQKNQSEILDCLKQIRFSLRRRKTANESVQSSMARSLQRLVSRDFVKDSSVQWNLRDQSMSSNFDYLYSKLSKRKKIIVWSANIHIAKDLGQIANLEDRVSFGHYIDQRFRGKVVNLGFSALSGSYAMIGQPVRDLVQAPVDSIEGADFQNSREEISYINKPALAKLGFCKARPIEYHFHEGNWSTAFDSIIVFRTEHPPEFTSDQNY